MFGKKFKVTNNAPLRRNKSSSYVIAKTKRKQCTRQSAAYKFEFANNVLACANKCKVVNDAQSCIDQQA